MGRGRLQGADMGRKLDDILDAASVTSLVRQLERPSGAARDPMDGVHAMHERVRLFCGVLRVLAEDPFQTRRETMALSLLDWATNELSRMLEWEASDFAPALVRERHHDGACYSSVDEFLTRHRQIVSSVIIVVDGIDQISRGGSPARPVDFALDVLQFIDVMKSYLRWQDDVLLPLARRVLAHEQLQGVVAALARRSVFASPELCIRSA